jgi:hypothetical protein
MIKHRYYLPTVIALSLPFGLIPTVASIVEYGAVVPFIPAVALGLLIGVILFTLCARWMKRSQSDGVVYLGWGTEVVIVLYIISVITVAWLTYTHMSWICPLLLVATEPIQCGIAFSVFRSTLELALLGGLYVWGLVYEKQIGRLLMYRMAFIEKHPGKT